MKKKKTSDRYRRRSYSSPNILEKHRKDHHKENRKTHVHFNTKDGKIPIGWKKLKRKMEIYLHPIIQPHAIEVYHQSFSFAVWFKYAFYYFTYWILGPFSWVIFFIVRLFYSKEASERMSI